MSRSTCAGVWANDIDVFGDIEDVTLDFLRLEPREPRRGVVVARVTLPTSCILELNRDLNPFQ